MDVTTSKPDAIDECSDVSIPVVVHSSLFAAVCTVDLYTQYMYSISTLQ